MRYLTVDEVLEINRTVLGERSTLRDYGLLDGAVMRPQQSVFGEDAYPDIHLKAGALLHSLARNHAFTDGNKRTALLATVVFYTRNGWLLDLEQGEAVRVVLDAAEGRMDADDLALALKDRATEISLMFGPDDE